MDTTTSPHREVIKIRPAAISDVAALRDLRLEALPSHPEAFSADYAEQASTPHSVGIEQIRQTEHPIIFLAYSSGA